MPHRIERLTEAEFPSAAAGLAELLADGVADGASLGFLAAFESEQAERWWREQELAERQVWIATDPEAGDRIDGTVTLLPAGKANARHRGEVVKLVVHRRARRRGLARALLAAAEAAALEAGITLLLLDTEAGSGAETLYLADGWTRYGVVPDYAADPAGVLRPCSFLYKQLTH